MDNVILNKEHLASYIDKCINDLTSSNSSQRLNELATLMQTLAQVINTDVFLALPQSIGSYASELLQFRTLVAFPLLGPEDRQKCQECIKAAATEGAEALQILKQELFVSANSDFGKIVKAMAIFSKHGYLMYTLRTQFTAVPSSRSMQDE